MLFFKVSQGHAEGFRQGHLQGQAEGIEEGYARARAAEEGGPEAIREDEE